MIRLTSILCLIHGCYSSFDSEVYVCSDGKIWQCLAKQTDELPIFDPARHQLFETGLLSKQRRKPANLYFSYLNKVNPDDGSVYLAARLKIELQQMLLKNATGILIKIAAKDGSTKPIFYHAQLVQIRSIPSRFTIDFTFPIENQLEYEKDYQLKFDLLPFHLGVSTQKSLSIPTYVLPDVDCDQKLEQDEKRQYVTSRFTSVFRQLTFYPYHSTVNLTFFAAPRSYCLSYEVQLALGGSMVIKSHLVQADEMQDFNGTTLIGHVTFTEILTDQSYSIRIIPYSATNSCVCFDCSCMLVQSEMFSLMPKATKTGTSKEIDFKHAQLLTEQLLRIQVVEDYKSNETSLMFLLIAFFCVLSLTFVSAGLIMLLYRNSIKPSALILVKSARISQQEQSLMSYKDRKVILLLNVEPSKTRLIQMLASMLEDANEHVNVVCLEQEQTAIEENAQMWCHDILLKTDKIILFHSNQAAYLISNKASKAKQISIFDTTFQILISLVRINDTRFVHACWDNQRVVLFHNIETVYFLPSNMQYVFSGLSLSLPTAEKCALFQEEYQRTMSVEKEVKESNLTEVTAVDAMVRLSSTTSALDEENEPLESGYITINSIQDDNKIATHEKRTRAECDSTRGLIVI